MNHLLGTVRIVTTAVPVKKILYRQYSIHWKLLSLFKFFYTSIFIIKQIDNILILLNNINNITINKNFLLDT